ncbi:MAG: DNA adenine methylase [Solirubrobacterales bacterium]
MSIEFLGSKDRLLEFLSAAIVAHAPKDGHFVDLFCGTASVSGAFRNQGLRVTANDQLALCSTMAEARLLNSGMPRFEALLEAGEVDSQPHEHPYESVLRRLNALQPRRGFVYRTYSPATARNSGVERRYFTPTNAAMIDAVRSQIAAWEGLLSRGERSLLIVDLVRAASTRSNTAGTYGCFLKTWKPRALEPLTLTLSRGLSRRRNDHAVYCSDATELAEALRADVVYADPPYTKRQYAAYYHVLETIVRNDRPIVSGKTGLRPWSEASSDFCYRRKAPAALERLISRLDAGHLFLSYSDDGQIPDSTIREILSAFGKLAVLETAYRRYRSSAGPHRGPTVVERLYHVAFA